MGLTPQNEQLSAIWPPSGVLLTALLLARWRDWPVLLLLAVLVGPFTSMPGHGPNTRTLLMSACNGLEVFVGAFLLRRYAGLNPSLERVRDVLALLAVALVSPVLNATPGVTLLALHGRIGWEQWWPQWRVFWVGDAMGLLLVTPLLLTWGMLDQVRWSRTRAREFAVLLLGLVTTLHLGFHGLPHGINPHHPITYTAFPFILWAALRFEARGTSLALLALAAVSVLHTITGSGPFVLEAHGAASPRASLIYLQSFLAVIGASGLLLAAAVGELRRAREKSERLNEELRASLEELATTQRELVHRERMAAVGELSASVAHEVRNPLGVIANAVAALTRSAQPDTNSTTWNLLGVMGEEVGRLDLLITGLVDFARPLEPNLLTQPLGPVVEGALESALSTEPRPSTLQVTRAVDPSLPDIPLDAQLLHRALHNLFLNAVQAMPKGGSLRVEITHSVKPPGPPHALITITDTGPGIAPEVMQRLFDPFFTTKALGTGLGLPIVRGIVEAHRGQVEVNSTLGQGTTILLRLPLHSTPRGFTTTEPSPRKASEVPPPPGAGSPPQKGMLSSSPPPPPP
ncbi:MASE1 domain-containing protein [Cystobacter fuscus]